ncbi:glutamate--tRNA ligase [Erysipelothrix urinaevulpis]|uniref:glutamate--tRNA ligase n=1 Tax=Erysipelothrix urinaevulpis TaxID=2683717 RepID=UPI001359392B|nr:glutamate--tRNA ligase [Erysipelothrix urinaevulpis]
MKRVRVRYAPSPTGFLHIGNARTALFDYLIAKHYDGDFVLRIEDTDIERNVEGGEESQLKYLEWLGIIPDESPQKPNPKYAPYRQMERLDIYKKYTNQLIEEGHAYKCYCTSEELDEDYQRQKDAGYASTRYSQKCLHLDEETKKQYEVEERPYSVRLKVPTDEVYTFEDIVRGTVTFESKDIGDWVIMKTNGIPTYNFAVVVDDYLMEISHVLRGEEHISNTPKQLMLFRMFGWEAPLYGHMTLIVNENHKKLSKRDNSIMQYISQYEEQGYLAEAMFNFMALLGWSYPGEKELFTHDELIEVFDESRLSKSPSMFDVNKLTWMNHQYLKDKTDEEWLAFVKPYASKNYDLSAKDEAWVDQCLLLYKEQLQFGAEITDLIEMFFKDTDLTDEAREVLAEDSTKVVAQTFLNNLPSDWTVEALKEAFNATKKESGLKGKPLFMGLRVAATHQNHGPDLMSSLYLLGRETIEKRLTDYVG